MSDLSQKVLDNIEQQHLEPKPRWRFLLHDGLIWGLFGLSVALGSIAIAVVFYYIFDFDLDTYTQLLQKSKWFLLITDMPYIWIIVTLLLIAVAYYYFRHTKQGYKHGFSKVILGSLLGSIIGGGIVYSVSDIPEYVDDLATKTVPFYEQVIITRGQRWVRPENGLLGGKMEKMDKKELILRDFHDQLWTIDISETRHPPRMRLREGVFLRIVGEKTDESHFKATIVQPWLLQRMKLRQVEEGESGMLLPLRHFFRIPKVGYFQRAMASC